MEYQALYRKYRPQRFDQVIGQEHVTETLSREIVEGRVAHAYLFAGPRGTGKTTTARILAKSLNCPSRDSEGEPCDSCPSCAGVAGSSSMDVLELDAASHNKVEDIRDLRASVSTVASIGGAKRIFILDEAHMLTKSASNALLKTLEEPPDHVHFVLATTEPYRLLDTIRSRSQRFDFHLVNAELIADHLDAISRAEGYRTSRPALLEVAQHAAGSVRDALSLLEQVAARDGSVTRQGVRDARGVAGPEAMSTLVEALVTSDAKVALELIAGLAASGVDLRRFAGDAMAFFRGVFLTMYTPNLQDITDEPAEVVARWDEVSRRLPVSSVMRAIDLLGEALVKLREGREERMMLELSILKLVRPELDNTADALLNRIEKLERGTPRVRVAPARPEPATDAPGAPTPLRPAPDEHLAGHPGFKPEHPAEETETGEPAVESRPPETDRPLVTDSQPASGPAQAQTGEPPTPADFDRIWPRLVAGVREEMGVIRGALFRDAIPGGVEGSTLIFAVPAGLDYHLQKLSSDPDLHGYLAGLAGRLLGTPVTVSFRAADHPVSGQEPETTQEGPPEPLPDKESLPEAPADSMDPLSLLEETFGARLVEED
ncbi:MAG: DNA polymerase III subunit gamma/tau [bacterium]|nr:DNA polymerase III subunit gamma/tau [bacterium]